MTLDLPFTDLYTFGVVNVDIGSPGTQYSLIFDPGSSNTWVGAGKKYVSTASSQKTSDTVAVQYGTGNFSGVEYIDTLTLNKVSFNQSIGVANTSNGIDDVDGLLGLGPTDLTIGTLSPDKSKSIPTVADNLYSEGDVESSTVTIVNKTITFGPTPLEDVLYAPITKTPGASTFWGIDASFSYDQANLVKSTVGIIDHGSTAIMFPTSAYKELLRLTNATAHADTGLPEVTPCDKLAPIILTVAGVNISIPVEHYRWPAEKNVAIGGDAKKCYLAITDIGSGSESLRKGPVGFRQSSVQGQAGLDTAVKFVLGYNTLKHFGVVLDTDNSQIGIAQVA